jgi:hypothetical protein
MYLVCCMINLIFLFHFTSQSNAILTKGMISLEPNSAAVFFPLQDQPGLLKNKATAETRDETKILLSGLEMNVMTRMGMFVQIESVVKYANKEYWQLFQDAQRHREGASRVPLLITSRDGSGSIAGIRIDVNRPVPEHLKKTIEEAILKLGDINISFTSNKNKSGRGKRCYYWLCLRQDDIKRRIRFCILYCRRSYSSQEQAVPEGQER